MQRALTDESLHGPVNAVAPEPVTNAEFARTLARALSRPALLPVPALVLRWVLGEMAEAPSLLKAYLTVGEALEASSLTAQEQQVVVLTVSYLNECSYCMTAHSAVAKMVGFPDDEIDALREGRPMSDAKLEALRTFTGILVEKRGGASEADVAAFLTAGYTRAQVLEVILGIAFKTMSNFTNHVADTPIDKQFAPFTWEPAGRVHSAV